MVNSNMKNLKNSKTSIILKRFLLSLFEFDFEKELTLLSQIEKNILILNPTYFQEVKVFIESGVKHHYPNPYSNPIDSCLTSWASISAIYLLTLTVVPLKMYMKSGDDVTL